MLDIQPHLPGMGPVLTVDLEGGQLLAWGALLVHHMGKRANCGWCQSCAEGREGGLIVFEWDPNDYKPGLGVSSDLAQAADILGFATEYAERGEEFDRDPSEAEQCYRSWWAEYGETFQAEVNDLMNEED